MTSRWYRHQRLFPRKDRSFHNMSTCGSQRGKKKTMSSDEQYMAEMKRRIVLSVKARNLKLIRNIEEHGETFKIWIVEKQE